MLDYCYGCFGRILQLPEELNENINKSYQRNLSKNEAYNFINKELDKYGKNLNLKVEEDMDLNYYNSY